MVDSIKKMKSVSNRQHGKTMTTLADQLKEKGMTEDQIKELLNKPYKHTHIETKVSKD